MKVGVAGASGYLGAELLRLLAGHPSLDVTVVQGDTSAGTPVAELYPSLAPAYGDLTYSDVEPDGLDGLDVIFVAVPSGRSQQLVPSLMERSGLVVDLGADFRLRDASMYPVWYGFEHAAPDYLQRAVYGLPELQREALAGASLVASPGCYVTAAALAIAPLVAAGTIEPSGVIVDAASGTSGAGRVPTATTHHSVVNESFSAYGLLHHRHTPEMEQATGATILFTPHLAPMTRGILATCYGRATSVAAGEGALAVLRDAYAGEPFVQVSDASPATRDTYGSNTVRLTARYDTRTGYVLAIAALDNLVKGGSGQAIQAANIALGLDERAGLPAVGVVP
jgi:N-acetyl-gamma-glutamyl-phosphate reductase